MPTLAVLGASGFTGRLVVAECLRQGHHPVLIGRDPQRIEASIDNDVEVAAIRRADVGDPTALREALDGVDVVLTTVGPFAQLGHDVLDAAIDTGTHYVDSTGEQPFIHWALTERDVAARDAGVVAVPAAGFDFLPGDLLASLAAGAVAWPSQVHVAYTVPSSGRSARRVSAGTRRTISAQLGRPGLAFEHGELIEEMPFESRRLAWFPRPVGPRHAAGIPGGEALTVPRHVADVRTVRTYLAVPSWKAEFGQMGANLARWAPARRVIRRALERGSSNPSPEVRTQTRWGCVAEVEGQDGVARAWAYGHDVYGLTAVSMVAVAEEILAREPLAGVRSPAAVSDPGELLDTIAARSDLRWSVARPEPEPPA